jgi:hypothetical protein
MTVHIDLIGVAILVLGCLVGRVVYQHTCPEQHTPSSGRLLAGRGDLVGAVGAGTAVVTVLVLLLGGTAQKETQVPSPAPATTAVSPSLPVSTR